MEERGKEGSVKERMKEREDGSERGTEGEDGI